MLSEKELLAYACDRFEEENFEEALEAFVLAYTKGYEQEWILSNIYNCYLEGNQKEFRNTYQNLACDTEISYEECLLDFIPYRDGEYYIFDKEIKMYATRRA